MLKNIGLEIIYCSIGYPLQPLVNETAPTQFPSSLDMLLSPYAITPSVLVLYRVHSTILTTYNLLNDERVIYLLECFFDL